MLTLKQRTIALIAAVDANDCLRSARRTWTEAMFLKELSRLVGCIVESDPQETRRRLCRLLEVLIKEEEKEGK
ncbi:hypothetical protein DOF57_24565 [Salmonella enterica]|uniref:Uncharacterized protein n=6 Tax=Salmonella enterica TaxID=28901 RepID=A0A5V7XUF6_SALMU|nr:hypothetical protein [Salmonella enterica]EAA1731240.1 hypothetical protein [Salmonella enterica subsp. enterica serovar Oranienburg]EAA1754675.1 hypothetical protein [Salmonella enterica subsp. enterica serovar Sundsvall]EAA2695391.1 hypothetical protein [Salmonella enterica subsp. enterica serovar Typhimurium]EAA5436938.1 hypothetical protein [Salmonella enterica subsp. enterica serovar Muenchen]EAA7339966.1 hypothetical protein [Salmonella enterica subsp. enterica]EAV6083510.1 hypotheti